MNKLQPSYTFVSSAWNLNIFFAYHPVTKPNPVCDDDVVAQCAKYVITFVFRRPELSIMPRRSRLDIIGVLHQIMVGKIDRADIFRDDVDRHGFLKKLGELIVISKGQIYAWALMTKHVHILYKSGEKGI